MLKCLNDCREGMLRGKLTRCKKETENCILCVCIRKQTTLNEHGAGQLKKRVDWQMRDLGKQLITPWGVAMNNLRPELVLCL